MCYYVANKLHVYIMALNIRNQEADQLAQAIAELTGETKTDAVRKALKERLQRLRRDRADRTLANELDEIGRRCAQRPRLDDRSDEAIIGFDEHGLPD